MEYTAKRNNPLAFYLRVFLNGFIGLLLRVLALAPLAALYVFQEGEPLRWLWTLCPVLVVFVVMPLRYSFAEALVQKKGSRYFSFGKSLSLSSYGTKLCEGALHFVNVIKYAIPLAAIALYVKKCYEELFVTEILQKVTDLGKEAVNLYYSVVNFVVKLFGGEAIQYAEGGVVEGIYVLLAVLGLALLILLIGVMRNSATRYIWALAERDNRPVRKEIRRRLRGRRFGQLLVALLNLVLFVPFFLLLYISVKDVLPDSASLTQSVLMMKAPEINFGTENYLMMAVAFFGGYMTLLPARRILTAWFATRDIRHQAQAKDEPTPIQPEYEPEEPVYQAAPVYQPAPPMQTMALPIEGMVAETRIVNGQPQIVYVPVDMQQAPAFLDADDQNGSGLNA